jgi:hypothetical protein
MLGALNTLTNTNPVRETNRFSIPLAALLSAANVHDPDHRLL